MRELSAVLVHSYVNNIADGVPCATRHPVRTRPSGRRSQTQTIAISRLRKSATPQLRFNNHPLTPTPTIRYLGIPLDSRLLFNQHVAQIKAAALRRLSKLKMIASTFFGTQPSILRQLVRGAILPILTYAIEAWGFRLQVQAIALTLNRIIRLCAIWILGALSSSPGPEVIHLAGLEDIRVRHLELLLRSAYFYQRTKLEPLIERAPRMQSPETRPTYTSAKLELAKELQQRIQAGLKPPWTILTYTYWKEEILALKIQHLTDQWNATVASGRRTLAWGPFYPWPKWTFRCYRRPQLTLLTQFLLAHWPARTYLHRIGKTESPLCRLCHEEEEDQLHIFSCPQLQEARSHLKPTPRDLIEIQHLIQKTKFRRFANPLSWPTISKVGNRNTDAYASGSLNAESRPHMPRAQGVCNT